MPDGIVAYLAVEREAKQHEEEHRRPKMGGGHFGERLRVHNENQAGACKSFSEQNGIRKCSKINNKKTNNN